MAMHQTYSYHIYCHTPFTLPSSLQVKTLIRVVRPDVVMLELCKDRVGLLVDDRLETQASNKWHVRKVSTPQSCGV